MPVIEQSSYKRPWYLFNPHLETIVPALSRRIKLPYERERLTLLDGDFVDLDWLDKGSRQLVVLSHGLEGNSDRHYVKGMAKLFAAKNWDVLAWNCRSCSGEMNRKLRLYNHGEIGDIGEVIDHALRTKDYEKVVLIGFSMGGNINLKYLGVNAKNLSPAIYKAIAFSSPVDLGESAAVLNFPENAFYKKRFLKQLFDKISKKAAQFPGTIDLSKFKEIKEWKDFDNFFSAPINGYRDADDFYAQASAINYMQDIPIPVLLVNALNDPILSPKCFPTAFCEAHEHIHLETPATGGHVGFSGGRNGYNWAEYRAWDFVNDSSAS